MVTIPTTEQLKTRFPEFINVSDARVTLFIEEATCSVDDCWVEKDQSPAIMALACHMMSLEGEPSASSGAGEGSDPSNTNFKDGRFLKRRKVGDTENEWAESSASMAAGSKSATASEAGYRSTTYGSKFYKLMKLNHSGMRVV